MKLIASPVTLSRLERELVQLLRPATIARYSLTPPTVTLADGQVIPFRLAEQGKRLYLKLARATRRIR